MTRSDGGIFLRTHEQLTVLREAPRTVVELCALWAVHCHFDPAASDATAAGPGPIDDDAVAAMLAELIVRATTPALD
jgi:hypothetical protein